MVTDKELCVPMKIYDPERMEWFIGRIWLDVITNKIMVCREEEM